MDCPYLTVRRAWHTENNRPVILDELKTKGCAAKYSVAGLLGGVSERDKSKFDSRNMWCRTGTAIRYPIRSLSGSGSILLPERSRNGFYYRYEDGKRVKHTVTPVLGEKAAHNGKVIYSLDFEVTPHQLRHTYITNLIHSSVDPKTVQYLAGHESSKITMDIYAKVKYNRPDELVRTMGGAFAQWDAV